MEQNLCNLGQLIRQMLAGQALPHPDLWNNALLAILNRIGPSKIRKLADLSPDLQQSLGAEATFQATRSFRLEATLLEQAARVHTWLGTLTDPERNLLVQWLDEREISGTHHNGAPDGMHALAELVRTSSHGNYAHRELPGSMAIVSKSDPVTEILAAMAVMARRGWTVDILAESCQQWIVADQPVAIWLLWFQACRKAICLNHWMPSKQNIMVGRFELLKSLGNGSFGEVHEALDTVLGRKVALKLPKANALGDNNWESVRQEARLAAAIDHPNVVPLLEVGDHQGRPFLISSIIRGPSMRQWLLDHAQIPLTAERVAGWVSMVAQGVQAIHDRGILHCDLKPGNILLDPSGPDDKAILIPRITDFGLSGRTGDVDNDTLAGPLGTPATMAPEQLLGRSGLSVRTDVYALGAILHELLCRKNHHDAKTVLEIYDRLENKSGPIAPQVPIPADLDAIRRRCLEPLPENRYASASEVSFDLQLFLKGHAPLAAKATTTGHFVRLCKRRPVLVSVASITFICIFSLLAMGCVLFWKLDAADRENRAATILASIEMNRKRLLEQQNLLSEVRTRLDDPDPGAISDSIKTLRLLPHNGIMNAESDVEIRSLALRAGLMPAIDRDQPLATSMGSYLVAWHPESKWLAISEPKGKLFLPSEIRFIDTQGHEPRPSLRITPSLVYQGRAGRQDGARAMVIDPSGRWLAVGTRGGWVNLYDLASPQKEPCCAVDGAIGTIENLAFHDGSNGISSANREGIVYWKRSGQKITKAASVSLKGLNVTNVAICPNANKVVVARNGASLEARDIVDPTKTFTCAPYEQQNVQAVFPYRNNMFFRQLDNVIEICVIGNLPAIADTQQIVFSPITRLTHSGASTGEFRMMAASAPHPSGNYIAMVMDDDWIRVWETFSGKQVCSWHEPYEPKSLAFSPDGRFLAVTGGLGAHMYQFQAPGLGMPLYTGVEEPESAYLDNTLPEISVFLRPGTGKPGSDTMARFIWADSNPNSIPKLSDSQRIDITNIVLFHRPPPSSPEWFSPAIANDDLPILPALLNIVNPVEINHLLPLSHGKILFATSKGLVLADRTHNQVVASWTNQVGISVGRAGTTQVVACGAGFLATSVDGQVRLFDENLRLKSGWLLGKYPLKCCICIKTPDGINRAVIGDQAGNLYLLNTHSEECPLPMASHRGVVNRLQSVNHENQTVVLSAGDAGKIRFWTLSKNTQLEPWAEITIGENAQILSVAGDRIVMGSSKQKALRLARWSALLEFLPDFRKEAQGHSD